MKTAGVWGKKPQKKKKKKKIVKLKKKKSGGQRGPKKQPNWGQVKEDE